MPTQTARSIEQCIENCVRCHRICLETAARHLREEGPIEPAHLRLLLDCAEICQTSANFMIRGSDLHAHTCGTCAEVCERCAEDCEQMGADDAHLKQCAEVCRRCAEGCRHMAQTAAA
jgi:hypothetical protein